MEWKIFFATFAAVVLAELGDKTQLVGLNITAESKKPFLVFMGSVSGYAVVTLVTVLIGDTLTKFVRPEYIKYAAGSLFIVIGILILSGKL